MPGLYRVDFKIPGVTGLMQRLSIHVQAHSEYDAFYKALPLLPPFSQVTRVKRLYP